MENKSGLGLSSMSESTELMVGAAVLVVLIIVIYLIWKWYTAPVVTPPAPAATMANRAVTIRGSSSTANSDNVNFQNSALVKSVDDILAHGYQHKYGTHPPRPHDAPGVDLEYKDLVSAGVFDPDMTVDQLDGLDMENRSSGQNQRLMSLQHDVNDLSKSVAQLTSAVKQSNNSPAVRAATDKVNNASNVVKSNLANMNH